MEQVAKPRRENAVCISRFETGSGRRLDDLLMLEDGQTASGSEVPDDVRFGFFHLVDPGRVR